MPRKRPHQNPQLRLTSLSIVCRRYSMFRPPNMILPDNTTVTYDTLPAIYPHEYNYGYNMTLLEEDPIEYPEGFDGFVLDQAEIEYLSPDPAMLNWKVPLRPHMGVLAVTPANATNWVRVDSFVCVRESMKIRDNSSYIAPRFVNCTT